MNSPTPWVPRVRPVVDGQPTSAAIANRGASDLAQRTDYLKQVLAELGGTLGSFVLYDQEIASDVPRGAPVYIDPATGMWNNATVRFVSIAAGAFEAQSKESQVMGVMFERTGSASSRGTILVMGEMLLTRAELDAILEDGVDTAEQDPDGGVSGSYYLCINKPGKMTKSQFVAIQSSFIGTMVGPDVQGKYRLLARPVPMFGNPMTNHVHYKFALEAKPAGTPNSDISQIPVGDQWDPIGGTRYLSNEPFGPYPGQRHSVSTPDADATGWLPATATYFPDKNIPVGARFGYNLAKNAVLASHWPPVPIEDASVLVNGVSVTPQLCVLNEDGIWWMDDCWGKAPWPVDYLYNWGDSSSGIPYLPYDLVTGSSAAIVAGPAIQYAFNASLHGVGMYNIQYSKNGVNYSTAKSLLIESTGNKTGTIALTEDDTWYVAGQEITLRVIFVNSSEVGVNPLGAPVPADTVGGVSLTFPTTPTLRYQLQFSLNGSTGWTDFQEFVTSWAASYTYVVLDTDPQVAANGGDADALFWRVVGLGQDDLSDKSCFVREMDIELHFTRNLFQSCAALVSSIVPHDAGTSIFACEPTGEGLYSPAATGSLRIRTNISTEDAAGADDDKLVVVDHEMDAELGHVFIRKPVVTEIVRGTGGILVEEVGESQADAARGRVKISFAEPTNDRYGSVDLIALDNVSEERYVAGDKVPMLYLGMPAARESGLVGKVVISDGPLFNANALEPTTTGQLTLRFRMILPSGGDRAAALATLTFAYSKLALGGALASISAATPVALSIVEGYDDAASFLVETAPFAVSSGDTVSFQLDRDTAGASLLGILAATYGIAYG